MPMSLLKRKNTKQKKISATFLAFVTPTLNPMGLSPEDPESETLIRVCWATWNAVVFPISSAGPISSTPCLIRHAQALPR